MPAVRSAPENEADDRASRLALLLLLFVLAWAVLWFVHALGYWEDDAYIHLEFARSIAHGRGFSFNGQVVYGDTSPVWVWLLAAFHAVIPGWIAAGKTLCAVAAVFALGGVYTLARGFTRELAPARSRLFAAAMLAVLVANPYFGYWAFSGMEALCAVGLVCWGLAAAGCEGLTAPLSPRRFLLGCVCAGVAPLLRPEMGFYTLLLGLILLVRWINMPVRFGPKLRLFFAGLVLVMGPAVAWGLYAVHTFGSILPNTNAAKRAGPHQNVALHLAEIYSFGFPLVVLGLLGLALWAGMGRRRAGGPSGTAVEHGLPPGGWLLFVWTALTCIFYIADHTYVQTRYIFVTAPVLTLALLALARKLWPRAYVAGVIFGVAFGVTLSLLSTWPLIRNKIVVDEDYATMATFLRTLPAHDPVAHYSIGEAAFLSQHRIIDLGGITRPGVIPYLWDTTENRRLLWAHAQGARYDVIDHQPEPGSVLVWWCTLPTTGWYLNPRRYRATERLMIWRLPLAPTIPIPPDMPVGDHEPFSILND